jgi:glycosyltransferase involved in cell wall biosynthesis
LTTAPQNTLPLRSRAFDDAAPATVSICTITCNHAAFITQCIEAFLDQICDFKVEIIIYDDASTDGTADIVRAYAEKHPTIIKPILSDRNMFSLGVNPYYGFVFPAARGEYIAICDGDDYWTDPAKLAKQVGYLNANPDVSLVYGPIVREIDGEMENDLRHGMQHDLTSEQLRTCPGINTLTSCFRNPGLEKPLAYIRHSPMGDITVWSILADRGNGHFQPEILPSVYRVTKGGMWSQKAESERFFLHIISYACVSSYHGSNGKTAAEKAILLKILRMILLRLGTLAVVGDLVKRLWSVTVRQFSQ